MASQNQMVLEIEAIINRSILEQTEKIIETVGTKSKETEKVITDSIGGAFKKVAAIAGAYLSFDTISKGLDLASDFTENRNKLEAVFEGQVDDADKFIKDMSDSLGLGYRQLEREMADVGAMIKGMGFEGEDLQIGTQATLKMAKDIASFYNVDLNDAIHKVTSGLAGETEALKALGIGIQDADMEEFAESHGQTWKDLNNTEKAYLRLIAVQKKLAQSGAKGDAEKTKNEYASVMRSIKSLAETIAGDFMMATKDALLPALQATQQFLIYNKDSIIAFGTSLAETTSKIVSGAFALEEFVSENWEVISVIGEVVVVLGGLVGAYKIAVEVTETWKSAQLLLNTALTLNPIGLVVTAVAALSYGIYKAYKNSEIFRNMINSLWEKLKGMWNWLKESKLGKLVGSILGNDEEVALKVEEHEVKTNKSINEKVEEIDNNITSNSNINNPYIPPQEFQSYDDFNNIGQNSQMLVNHQYTYNINSDDEVLRGKLEETIRNTIEEHEREKRLNLGII